MSIYCLFAFKDYAAPRGIKITVENLYFFKRTKWKE
jgi:hypothetical protein